MKKKIIISIIIPILNFNENLLRIFLKQLENLEKSKNSPTYKILFDVLIINNKKADNLNNFFRIKYLNLYKFKLLNYKNEGNPGLARNHGLKKSIGDYVIFLDFNDKLIISNFLKIIKNIEKDEDVIIFKYSKLFDKKNNNLHKQNILKKKIISNILRREYDESCNYYLFRKNYLIKNKIFFGKGFYEDRIFLLKSFFFAKIIKRIKIKAYIKIPNKNSITNSFSKKHVIDFVNSSIEKNLFINKYIKKKAYYYKKDLQYGLRGDFIHIFKKSTMFKKNLYGNFIIKSYLNIINLNYKIKTTIDYKVRKILKDV